MKAGEKERHRICDPIYVSESVLHGVDSHATSCAQRWAERRRVSPAANVYNSSQSKIVMRPFSSFDVVAVNVCVCVNLLMLLLSLLLVTFSSFVSLLPNELQWEQ